jgi:hypothetical protein
MGVEDAMDRVQDRVLSGVADAPVEQKREIQAVAAAGGAGRGPVEGAVAGVQLPAAEVPAVAFQTG